MKTFKILTILFFYFYSNNVFSQNCQNTSRGYPPINDLGAGYWHGAQGGLYPGGSNIRPAAHNNGGLLKASQVRDANDYRSGVYVYKLISGDFVESKKMVLIK